MMQTRQYLWIVLALLIVGIGAWLYFSADTIDVVNKNSTGTSIVAFGDSLVQGVGSTPDHDFVSLLSADIGTPIINLGKSGDTTAAGLERIDTIFEHNPRIVILLLGGNDFLRRVPVETTFANLAQIITTIQSRGAAVLLLGVRGGLLSDGYDEHFESLAETYGTAFVPDVLDGLIGNRQYMSDQIHPNDVGYARIADRVLPVLDSLLK